MSRAQRELRGPLAQEPPRQVDAEEQYAGGDAAAQAGTLDQARRTVAFKAYRDRLGGLGLQEVWSHGHLISFRTSHTGSTLADLSLSEELGRQRAAALAIGRLCRDVHEDVVAVSVVGTAEVERFAVQLHCHQPAGHPPGQNDGGHRTDSGSTW